MSAALSLFLFGAVTAALALQYPLGSLRMPGSGFFPLVLGVALMALAAGHGIRLHLAKSRAARAAAPPAPSAAPPAPAAGDGATLRVVLFMGAVAAATALLQPLGYAPVSFLMMLALLQILGVRRWRVSVPIALGSAVVSHFVFVEWLKIPLPSGGWF